MGRDGEVIGLDTVKDAENTDDAMDVSIIILERKYYYPMISIDAFRFSYEDLCCSSSSQDSLNIVPTSSCRK
jgi:hypothetical protein